MEYVECESRNLNVDYDSSDAEWEKVVWCYRQMPGWLGIGDGTRGESGIPYWFSYDESKKSIWASVEPSGLMFVASHIDRHEWEAWLAQLKLLATQQLGYRVGEIELGEVDYDKEWLDN